MDQATLELMRKMAKALDRTQYYTADRMQAYQRKLLEPLLRHARQEVPFYATRLAPLFGQDDTIEIDDFHPVMSEP